PRCARPAERWVHRRRLLCGDEAASGGGSGREPAHLVGAGQQVGELVRVVVVAGSNALRPVAGLACFAVVLGIYSATFAAAIARQSLAAWANRGSVAARYASRARVSAIASRLWREAIQAALARPSGRMRRGVPSSADEAVVASFSHALASSASPSGIGST